VKSIKVSIALLSSLSSSAGGLTLLRHNPSYGSSGLAAFLSKLSVPPVGERLLQRQPALGGVALTVHTDPLRRVRCCIGSTAARSGSSPSYS
jgi:hypothetical protein